jgi:amidase
MFSSYDRLEKLVEPVIVSKYSTTAGYPPSSELNPYNAWARLVDIAGSGTGKLAGKTVAIKDNVHISGVPMANGSHFFRGFVSSYSATVVNRILEEGMAYVIFL